MKKVFYIILFSLYSTTTLIGQNILLSNSSGSLNNGDTVYVFLASDDDVEAHIFVENNSATDMNIFVRKDVHELLVGAFNTFCWGQCFSPTVEVSSHGVMISAGSTNNTDFYADYSPLGQDGTTLVRYIFFNEANENDTSSVFLKFVSSPSSVYNFQYKQTEISVPYPNPSSSYCNFSYTLPIGVAEASFIIRDITGNIQYTSILGASKGKITIDVSDFAPGIYFYSVILNGQTVITRKMMIQR